jgi:hypothetical protein
VRWVRGFNYNTYIYAVSDDGRVMGGDIQFDTAAGEEESVLWFDGEPVFLRDYLRDHGYPDAFKDHFNTGRITAVSPTAGRSSATTAVSSAPSTATASSSSFRSWTRNETAPDGPRHSLGRPGFSQGFEVTALAGYTTPGSLQHDTRTLDDLKLAGSSPGERAWASSSRRAWASRRPGRAWAAASSCPRPRPARRCST